MQDHVVPVLLLNILSWIRIVKIHQKVGIAHSIDVLKQEQVHEFVQLFLL